ncbi:hypothetical protein QF25_08225 [Salmonella enterica subsp. enterica]|nr:hypothetical protein [Salmonella enterica subsp. enterica]EDW1098078.1 hypothetical protein [Salmonella enterica subsp. enterica]MIM32638.1 hypothetical protein [Salmonella enterica subsp. enterica]
MTPEQACVVLKNVSADNLLALSSQHIDLFPAEVARIIAAMHNLSESDATQTLRNFGSLTARELTVKDFCEYIQCNSISIINELGDHPLTDAQLLDAMYNGDDDAEIEWQIRHGK